VVKYKKTNVESSLSTEHSWLGIGALCLFCVNYLLGSTMAILTQWFPTSPIKTKLPLGFVHKFLGLSCFAFTVAACVTGIMEQIGRGGCSYIGVDLTEVEDNPAKNYHSMPDACKIANGLGVVMVIASTTAVLAVASRLPLAAPASASTRGVGNLEFAVNPSLPSAPPIAATVMPARIAPPADGPAPSSRSMSNKGGAGVGVALAVVCFALVAALARDNTENGDKNSVGFLGRPDWYSDLADKVLAWHPLLMVAGFFFSQVMAMLSWSFMPTHYSAKLMHVFWQSAALATLGAGMASVVKYKRILKVENSLSTEHSWLGIGALCLFCVNYLLGSTMAILTQWFPTSPIKTKLPLGFVHKFLGLSCFAFTVAACVTGIMEQIGRGGCSYIGVDLTEVEDNPAVHYSNLPNACKIANGLGVLIVMAASVAVLAVASRAPFARVPGAGESAVNVGVKAIGPAPDHAGECNIGMGDLSNKQRTSVECV
jgi:hypothetical protein